MKLRNEEEGPRAPLEKIELDLAAYKIFLHFKDHEEPLVLYFDTPSRRFYFALIALVMTEMKNLGKPGFIHIRKHEEILKLLDHSLAGQHASETVHGMWEKIRITWHYTLPDLEEAVQFKILDRDRIAPYEKGGKYRYECSEEESDTWANLFAYDENNPWRFKFAVDSVSLSLEDLSLTFEDLRDNAAWQGFVKGLSMELSPAEEKEVGERATPKRWYRAAVAGVAVLIIVAAGVAIRHLWFRPVPPPAELELPHKTSIAILPFLNMDDDPDKEYFCDGITEELINSLARLRDLHVISRTSTFYLKDKALDLRTIGQKLNVDHVLEGSVRVSGNRLRISAQLIKVNDDSHLWAETYDRKMEDIFDTQADLAQEIACSLKSRLGCKGDEIFNKHYTENVEAYNIYLKGRYLHNIMNPNAYQKAIDQYNQALQIDPKYALAYSGLGDSYLFLGMMGSINPKDVFPKAKAAVMKAIEIDNSLSEAYTALGRLKTFYEWDWPGAEKALKRAIELNPGSADAHIMYSQYLWVMDRLEEGLAHAKRAEELDPLSLFIITTKGVNLRFMRKTDQAIDQHKKALELYPDNPRALQKLAACYIDKEMYGEVIQIYEKLSERFPKNPLHSGHLGMAYAKKGMVDKAQGILDELLEIRKKSYFSSHFIASIYMGLGDKDKVFEWLNIATNEHDLFMFPIKVIPEWDLIRSDPRYISILKKMGLEG